MTNKLTSRPPNTSLLNTIAQTPAIILSIASVLPILLIDLHSVIWASLNIIMLIFFSLWLYSITTLILKKATKEVQFDYTKFKIVLITALMYMLFLSVYYIFTFDNYNEPPWLLLLVIIGNIFAGYAYFYLLHNTAKLMTDTAAATSTSEGYLKYFICLVAFPFGIWWIKPSLNRLI